MTVLSMAERPGVAGPPVAAVSQGVRSTGSEAGMIWNPALYGSLNGLTAAGAAVLCYSLRCIVTSNIVLNSGWSDHVQPAKAK